MSVNSFNCAIPKELKQNGKNRPFTPDELSNVEKRAQMLQERLMSTARAMAPELEKDAQEFAETTMKRWTKVARMMEAETLKPGSNKNIVKWLEFQLAEKFAVWKNMAGFGEGVTEAGAVRQALQRTGRKYGGSVADILSEIGASNKVYDVQKASRKALKGSGLNKYEVDAIIQNAQEVGWQRYLEEGINTGEAGKQLLAAKQRDLLERLKGHGLSPDEVETVVNGGKEIADTYHGIYQAVSELGVDMGDASKLIGYSPRLFTDEAISRMKWNLEANGVSFGNLKNKNTTKLEDLITASRTTNEFVVEDAALLDFLLRRNDPEVYTKLGVKDAMELIGEHNKVGEALFNHLGSDTVEALVDTGIMSKIPMTSQEVFDYMVRRYELPFDGVNELMVVDPIKALKLYKNQLESLATDSGKSWLLLRNAMDGSWGVSKKEVMSNPQKFKGFQPLSEVVPDNLKQRFGLSEGGLYGTKGANSTLFTTLEDTYAHPVAANMFKAVLDISSDPNSMATFARILNTVNKTFRSLVMTTTGTVMRIVWGNAFQVVGAGGSLFEYGQQAAKWIGLSLTGNQGERAAKRLFDDTKKMYKGLGGEAVTEYQLYRQAVAEGFLNDLTSLTGDAVQSSNKAGNYLTKAPKYLADTVMKYGLLSGKPIQEVSEWFSHLAADKVGVPFRMANNTLDNAAKFSILKSVTTDSMLENLGQFATLNTKKVRSLEEAIEHAQDYFFWYDDLGTVDKVMGRYIAPFWTYMSRNPVAQVRSAMRNPGKFMSYHRMYAAMNAPASGEGDDLPSGSLQGYQLDQKNVYWVIPADQSATGKREYFAISMSGVDPVADGQQFAGEVGSNILSMFGFKKDPKTGNLSERIAANSPWSKTETNNTLSKYLSGDMSSTITAYPVVQAAYKAVTGKDNYGKNIEEFDVTGNKVQKSLLGYKVNPLAKMWFETLLPPLASLDRLNPGNAFGKPEIKDAQGNITQQAQGSQMPQLPGLEPAEARARSSQKDINRTKVGEQNKGGFFSLPTLDPLGVNVNYIDVAKQMGYSEKEIVDAMKAGKNAIIKTRLSLKDSDPKKRKETEERIAEYIQQYVYLQSEYRGMVRWREQRGIPMYGRQQANTQSQRIYDPQDREDILKELIK